MDMDTQMTEEELRSLAYRLWEEAGCPDGRADEFWEQARLQLCPDGSPTGNVKLSWAPGKMGHEKEQVTLLWFSISGGGH
jgi:Protein of unknown function (DUF2934)